MAAQTIALLILLPFTVAFIYAAFHEFRRYKYEGRAVYGLAYDEETGTTHVTGIAEGEDAYDPDNYDPSDYNDPESKQDPNEAKT
ncbi:hypothetical protein [Salipiger mucosus]|uniref:Uncharacterized protein n=1 Tax=Salipiger mucosus DSM 16094 TaxID=1123237 RepID=S9QGG9_9RHOB|nr:hypothetical protein [Salipiger mucosus]EPX80516.1 hypothetical protein Salmuc_03833 [Salipiger mucosus DSM 16094]